MHPSQSTPGTTTGPTQPSSPPAQTRPGAPASNLDAGIAASIATAGCDRVATTQIAAHANCIRVLLVYGRQLSDQEDTLQRQRSEIEAQVRAAAEQPRPASDEEFVSGVVAAAEKAVAALGIQSRNERVSIAVAVVSPEDPGYRVTYLGVGDCCVWHVIGSVVYLKQTEQRMQLGKVELVGREVAPWQPDRIAIPANGSEYLLLAPTACPPEQLVPGQSELSLERWWPLLLLLSLLALLLALGQLLATSSIPAQVVPTPAVVQPAPAPSPGATRVEQATEPAVQPHSIRPGPAATLTAIAFALGVLSQAPAAPAFAQPALVTTSGGENTDLSSERYAVRLLNPVDGATLGGVERFTWLPREPLPKGYGYEVVFWQDGSTVRYGIAALVEMPMVDADVTAALQREPLNRLLTNGPNLCWGVRAVSNAGKVVGLLSSGCRHLVYREPPPDTNLGPPPTLPPELITKPD